MSTQVFCRQHAFYDCPVCRGEEIVWEIPIIDHGVQTGILRVTSDAEAEVIGELRVPVLSQAAPLPRQPRPKKAHITQTEPTIPAALATRVASMFSTFDSLMGDPRHRAAAAQGKRIHENAIARSKAEGISYAEALHQGLQDQGDQSLPEATK